MFFPTYLGKMGDISQIFFTFAPCFCSFSFRINIKIINMKKTFTFFAALMMLTLTLQANPVTQEQAATVCRNFLAQKQANHNIESTEFQYLKTAFHNGEAYAYIFRCLPVGYVAISASDRGVLLFRERLPVEPRFRLRHGGLRQHHYLPRAYW